MAGPLSDAIAIQIEKTIKITRRVIQSFSKEQWMQGISHFEVPAKVAYHIVRSLDRYFRQVKEKEYDEGHRFSRRWDELSDEMLPPQEAVVDFLDDTALKIKNFLQQIDDSDLAAPHNDRITVLGHCIYAVRHTMHHQGALTALAVYHKCDPDVWE